MKRSLFATLLTLAACAHSLSKNENAPSFNAPNAHEASEFVPHLEEKPFQAYLAMALPYPPFLNLRNQLEKSEGLSLKNRGEAHITVISPIEYDQVLKKHFSIAEIHDIADQFQIQKARWTPLCIGRGQKELQGKTEKTYFVVIESPDLLELRDLIGKAYQKKGGKAAEFEPRKYSPHVTLGFTARDLHFEDGVLKDKSSCLYSFTN